MEDELLKEVFDFEELAFQRIEGKLFYGLTLKEFYRLMGLLYSLNRDQSKELLKRFRIRYGLCITRGWVYVE